MKHIWFFFAAGAIWLQAAQVGRCDEAKVRLPPPADREIDFVRDVRPLFEQHCWACHGADLQESGLRLDRRSTLLEGGDLGRVVVPGDSASSRLVHSIAGADPDLRMPPDDEPLPAEAIGVLRAWIDQGCVWPASEQTPEEENIHWAYQPLRLVPPPAVRRADWPINPIDHFVLAELEKRGLQPSPEADRYTLIRRLYLDLLGLLPPVDEVDAFVQDARDDAFERLVDRLMQSPHFGERWGRHWLDMARYADSDGYEKDNARPDAYRYRDWVIDAINADLPFDQFTIEQLAGDLLADATPMQQLATAFHRQTLTNTEGGVDQEEFRVEACFDRTETTGTVWLGLTIGCARCHTHKYDAISQREYFQLFAVFNNADEQTAVVPKSDAEVAAYQPAKAAHDTQLEQLTARLRAEQARLVAELAARETQIRAMLDAAAADPLRRHASEDRQPQNDGQATSQPQSGIEPEVAVPEEIAKLLAIAASERNESQRQQLLDYFSRFETATKELLDQLDQVRSKPPPKPELTVRVLGQRTQNPRQTYVLRRGEFLEPILDLEVSPAGLAILPPLEPRRKEGDADRLDLARWLISPDNPLTPRVTVNHIWRRLMGSGLVRTPGDFGVRGEPPTHPELLDWLALDLLALPRGDDTAGPAATAWSRKSLIKRIVMSATYRQSSQHRAELTEADPLNAWLARQNRVRVDGEIVRDISLDAAGLLSRKIGGPSVYPPLPPGITDLSYAGNFRWNESQGEDRYRRGMYTFFKRTAPHPNLIVFDCPDANLTHVERQTSNTPLQALTTLNEVAFVEASRALARRMLARACADDNERLAAAWRVCLARPAAEAERSELAGLLTEAQRWYAEHLDQAQQLIAADSAPGTSPERNAAWITVSRILLNLDEFLTRQ